jgi:hypothetical protein
MGMFGGEEQWTGIEQKMSMWLRKRGDETFSKSHVVGIAGEWWPFSGLCDRRKSDSFFWDHVKRKGVMRKSSSSLVGRNGDEKDSDMDRKEGF